MTSSRYIHFHKEKRECERENSHHRVRISMCLFLFKRTADQLTTVDNEHDETQTIIRKNSHSETA